MTTKITIENFDTEVLGTEKVVILDFWAPWCGPCRMLAPTMEQISKEQSDKAIVGKINIDEQRYIHDLFLKHATSADIYDFDRRRSVLDKKEFDTINNELGNKYIHPQNIGQWHTMNTEYIHKMSFVHVYDTLLHAPKELVQLIVDYL